MNSSKTCNGNFVNVELLQKHSLLCRLATEGMFGLEKEHVRSTLDGRLAMTTHPEALGNKADHPYITTDFSESQVEMITPPMPTVKEAHGFMKTLHQIVVQALPPDELLWMQSMPPILPEDESEIPVARFEGNSSFKTEYRERLSEIYGRGRQMISGSHFNFSFKASFVEELARILGTDSATLGSKVYMKMVRNLMRYRWWLVGALGRSPSAHDSLRLKSFDSDHLSKVCCDFGVSIRASRIGYRNPNPLETNYCTLEGYLQALDDHISRGKLLNRNELYMPIRLKLAAQTDTISHLEIRLLDLDPFDPIGMPIDSLRLLHLFCVFSLLEPESDLFDLEAQKLADEMQNHVATIGYSNEIPCCGEILDGIDFEKQALEICEKMRLVLDHLEFEPEEQQAYEAVLGNVCKLIIGEHSYPSKRIREGVQHQGFVDFHLEMAAKSLKEMNQVQFQFFGLEDMELSTQLLLKEAVKRGVHFDILDRGENFVRLFKHGKEEYVMQATRTSLDNYSSVLLMENKLTTKEVLSRSGIRVPDGFHFGNEKTAKASWDAVAGKSVVIKPKTTNFGLGITILKTNDRREVFERAVELAFKEDREILIERFVKGREFRFFLIDSQVVGVLHRVPANVKGDGVHTIRYLVEEKNKDPLRGKGYRTPLEKIQLGEAEAMFLESQGFDFDTVPAEGEIVYLRENSNISTGGDSLDFTETIHHSYHEIAAKAARALNVRITGLDMIIQDVYQPANDENHAIIEMNFNPAIHIHCFPFEGKNRHLDKALLNQLGFL